jgi:hypothetical protein
MSIDLITISKYRKITQLHLLNKEDEIVYETKWNNRTMSTNISIGFKCKEYTFNRSVINLHSGTMFHIFKER